MIASASYTILLFHNFFSITKAEAPREVAL